MGACLDVEKETWNPLAQDLLEDKDTDDIDIGKVNPDDFVSVETIKTRMKRNGFSNKLIDHFMELLDPNKNKTITWQRFNDTFAYWKLLRVYHQVFMDIPRDIDDEIDISTSVVAKQQFIHALLNGNVVLNAGRKDSAVIANTTDDLLREFVDKLDKHCNDAVTLKEMKQAYELAKSCRLFDYLDDNQDGLIEVKDCVKYFKTRRYSSQAIHLAFGDSDTNLSGTLNFKAFHEMFVEALFRRQRDVMEIMMINHVFFD
eukprot:253150_1